jgi:hypothetical protein
MSAQFIFMSYAAEIPWVIRLARALQQRGVASELWVFDEREFAMGERSGAFHHVENLLRGYTRPSIGGEHSRETLLKSASAMESDLGSETFFHREAAGDRMLTGRNHIELPPLRMRNRWTWEDVCGMALHLQSAVTRRLEATKPVAVVGEATNFAERVIARVVMKSERAFLMPLVVPYLDDRIHFTDGVECQWPRCIELFRQLQPGEMPTDAEEVARATLRTMRAGSTMHTRREDIRDYLPTFWHRIHPQRVTRLFTDWVVAKGDEATVSPHVSYPELTSPRARLVRKASRRRLRSAFDAESAAALPESPFAAYFIHAQPEVTVDGWAFEYQDQAATIRNIAAALPADLVLVVKEHRVQAGWRDPGFYKELLSIPGIVVVNDQVPAGHVVRRAEIVFTLTGTVSLEAMCLGVPAVIFGSIYYEQFPGIRRVRSWSELRAVVNERDRLPRATEEECLRALAARYLASRPGGWMSGGRFDADEHVTAQALIDETASVA